MVILSKLETEGWAVIPTSVTSDLRQRLRESIFAEGKAGSRCLLDDPDVKETAAGLKAELIGLGILPADSVAIQAIAFDKTAETNWKVAWHQDLMFPFARPVTAGGFTLPSRKAGVDFARPPLPVLQQLLAVRLHLDECDQSNGPLRVSPGSHRSGLIPSEECAAVAAVNGKLTCLAQEGDALLMRPLILHASSQATSPKHRRVLHLVYHTGEPTSEEWHRRV